MVGEAGTGVQRGEPDGLLADLVREAAFQGGVIPFRHYMELALYHPRWGYYTTSRGPLGREGDFITAPELTSLFGELLTLQCIEVWELLGRPDPFVVVEGGPGNGRLAADLWRTGRRFPAFLGALRLVLVEVSPPLRERQQGVLQEAGVDAGRVRWCDAPSRLDPFVGVLLANELLDALPVHWVEQTADGLRELGVRPTARGLERVVMDPRPPLPVDYFVAQGIALEPGYRTEVGLAAREWWREAAGALERGVLLTIDYGYPASELYAPVRYQGTLTGFHRHTQVTDPLAFPGAMDLTAHVDFSAIARAGEESGLATLGFTTQGWFLMGLGILERLERLLPTLGAREAEALRQTVMRLILPQGMGERFKVLAQGRGMAGVALSGFRLDDQRERL